MQISDLRIFVAVIESGSLTKAGTRLSMSQPTISERMTQLEASLGVRLLDRTPRGVRPTSAGREFYARANAILRQFDELPDAVADGRVTGSVSIGLPVTVGLTLGASLVEWMHDHHPSIHVQVFESFSGYLRELLAWERVDMAVLYREANVRHTGEEVLFSEDLYLLGQRGTWFGASSDDDDEIDLAEAATLPLVLPGQHSNMRIAIDNACRAAGIRLTTMADVEALRPAAELVARGRACTILPSSVIAGYPDLDLDGRRIVNPTIRRFASLIDAPHHDRSNEANAALRQGIKTLVNSLHAEGKWRGITPYCSPSPSSSSSSSA